LPTFKKYLNIFLEYLFILRIFSFVRVMESLGARYGFFSSAALERVPSRGKALAAAQPGVKQYSD